MCNNETCLKYLVGIDFIAISFHSTHHFGATHKVILLWSVWSHLTSWNSCYNTSCRELSVKIPQLIKMFKTVQLWTTQLDPIELLCICLPLTQYKTVCNSHTWDSKSAVINLCLLIVYLIISLPGLATSHHHHSQYQFHNYTFLEKN